MIYKVLHSERQNMVLMCSSIGAVLIMWVQLVRGDAMSPERCSNSNSSSSSSSPLRQCEAMVGYVPSDNRRLSQIASLFSLPSYSSLLGPNDIDPAALSSLVLPSNKLYNIPQTCGCVNGVRTVTSTFYSVKDGDTLSTIAEVYYANLITYQEIGAANNVSNLDSIFPFQNFSIPIPCACFHDSGHGSLFLSYPIQNGDTLQLIAANYNTSVSDLTDLNPAVANTTLTASSILFVPLPVCKVNFSIDAVDNDLKVVEGMYELTANNCVQCSCTTNGILHCIQAPSSLGGGTCSNITCPSSSLSLGASTTSKGSHKCVVESCIYKGYNKTHIISILEVEEDLTCPVAPPPETFYKPPLGLVASPLGSSSPSMPSTPPLPATSSPPPSSSTSNPSSSAASTTLHTVIKLHHSLSWCILALLVI